MQLKLETCEVDWLYGLDKVRLLNLKPPQQLSYEAHDIHLRRRTVSKYNNYAGILVMIYVPQFKLKRIVAASTCIRTLVSHVGNQTCTIQSKESPLLNRVIIIYSWASRRATL